MAKATQAPLLLHRVLGHPGGSVALASDAGNATYGQLAAGSARIARRLLDGRRSLAGSRVILLLPPGPDFVQALLGIWRAGGVAVPVTPLQTAPELDHITATASPELTIADADSSEKLAAWMDGAGASRIGRRIDARGLTGGAQPPDAGGEPLAADVTGAAPAIMLFTSGTTGSPKGVALSHAGVAATVEALAEAWRWRAGDRLLHALPLHHTHGLIVALLGALGAGAAVQFTAFDAGLVWEAFARSTVFMAVPTMYVRLVEALRALPTAEQRARWADGARGLRLATSGSAALSASLWNAFAELTGQTILERYGMTEIGMALSNPYDGPRVPGSVGLPLPGVIADIVDDQDAMVSDGQPGELRVRSPQLFLGYHGDAAATAASYDANGRFRTGDTAVRLADGYIRLLGRTSVDILKSGGYKLSALEIEEVLRGHPAIADVAVIGVPDPEWGDCVTACVVPRANATPPTIDELRAFARDALAPYKLPRALRLLPALPRNPMGKVQKSLLK